MTIALQLTLLNVVLILAAVALVLFIVGWRR
jgi:hypothetical protein